MTGAAEWQALLDAVRSLGGFFKATLIIEMLAIALCVALAWGLGTLLRRSVHQSDPRSIIFGRKVIDGVLFPVLLLGLAMGAKALVGLWVPLAAFKLLIPVVTSLVVIRLGAKVLQAVFPNQGWVRPIERSISWLAWLTVVLWITGLLPVVLTELDQISWRIGGSKVSARTLIEGALTTGALMIVVLWISAGIESRLLSTATGAELSLRKALSKLVTALLLGVGLIVALNTVGIDLSALSVLGGAVGVGIGFGLQKLAANYVSGFVILAERSMRIGDNVRVDNFEGRITDIHGRYTVIRSMGGRESIVPNEMLLTSRVENLTLADPRLWQSTVVSVAYDSDVDLVMRLLKEAALACERVMKDPGPSVALSSFGADGLEFTVGFWIADPDASVLPLRSQINLAILRSLREHGIDIPYPQRVLHVANGAGAALATPAAAA